MSQPFSFPGGQTTYVPTLSNDLAVIFARSEFPINRYIGRRKVDKMVGYWRQMKNDNQVRAVRPEDFYWPIGNDAPKLTTGNDAFTFQPYACKRYGYVSELGYEDVEQGAWDVLAETSMYRQSQGMTARSVRVATALTTSTNYPTANYAATSGAISGSGAWKSGTSSAPYIKVAVQYMQNLICQGTNGVVTPDDLILVMNPTTATTQVAQSQEFIDFLKQSPDSLSIFDGKNFNMRWGLPPSIYGVQLVVDDTVKTTSAVNPASSTYTPAYTLPDNAVVMLTKQNAIKSAVGNAFSTFQILEYTPGFEVFVYNDVKNRRYDVQVVENAAEVVFAGVSGFYIASVNS
jgi:hypothetical protein